MSVNWPIIDIFKMLVPLPGKEESDSCSFAIICLSIVRNTDSC